MTALSPRNPNERIQSPLNEHNKQMATGPESQSFLDSKDHIKATTAKGSVNMRRQIFTASAGEQNAQKPYISPSDAIQSPASQKLASFKKKQINKQGAAKNPTARSLFARTASSCDGLGFEDLSTSQEKDDS